MCSESIRHREALNKMEIKIKESYWEDNNLIIISEDDKKWTFTDAYLKNMRFESTESESSETTNIESVKSWREKDND